MNLIKLFLVIVLNSFLYANPILLDDSEKTIDVLSQAEIYVDKTRNLTIDDIQDKNIKFEKNNKPLLGYGYSPNFDVWVKFTLKNTTDKKIEKILEYDNSITTHVSFFDLEKNNELKEGSFNKKEDRKTLNPMFSISLDSFEEKTYFIKATSVITTLIIKLKLWNIDEFYNKEIKHQVILALFFGAMIILVFYNLFIYFITKDISYLFYVLYVLGIVFHHLMYVGFANIYLLDEMMMVFVTKYAVLLSTFPILALALFIKFFLKTKQYKKVNFVLNVFLWVVPFSIFFFIFTDEYNNYRNLLPLLLFVYLLVITIFASIKKNKQSNFLLIGWSAIILAIIFMYLSSRGIFDIYKYYSYIIETSFIFEAVIFSIALADRIKQLQKEKNEINKKLIIQQKEEGKRLKVQVEEKTKDLKEALDEKGLLLKELSHRVKNNMQMIISLLRLQADEIDDERVDSILETVQNRIKAMSHLHELLYQQDNISHVNAFDYFDMLIDDLNQSFNTENIEIDLDIKTDLKIEQAIYCGIILNELVTNAIKYAFEDKNGTINVSLQKVDNKYRFNIKDNGKGYKDLGKSNSLGVLLVETLSTKQLGGDININTQNGVEVDILWSSNDKNEGVNS